jgi:hypothetical protein
MTDVILVKDGVVDSVIRNSADPLAVALTDKGLTFATALVSFGALVILENRRLHSKMTGITA